MTTRCSRSDYAWAVYLLLLIAHGIAVMFGWRTSDAWTWWGRVRDTWDVFGVLAAVAPIAAALLTSVDSAQQAKRDRVLNLIKSVVVGGLLLLVMYGSDRVVVGVETVLAALGLGWLVWRRLHPTTENALD